MALYAALRFAFDTNIGRPAVPGGCMKKLGPTWPVTAGATGLSCPVLSHLTSVNTISFIQVVVPWGTPDVD